MRAAVHYKANTPLVIERFELPDVADGERCLPFGLAYRQRRVG